jgi:hypothetical protein
MRASPPKIYDWTLRGGIAAGIVGWLIIVAGFATASKPIIRAGTALFLMTFVAWGLGNGGAFVWRIWRDTRDRGVRESFREEPVAATIYLVLTLFFLSVGVYVAWGIGRFLIFPH